MIRQSGEGSLNGVFHAKRNVHVGAAFAVLPIDAFTGQPVRARDFIVEMRGKHPSVRKSDGLFVFSNVLPECGETGAPQQEKEETAAVRLAGRGYREEIVNLRTDEIREKALTFTIPVSPDRDYPFPPNTVRMEGKLSARSCLRAVLLQKTACRRLALDYRAGERTIAIYRGEQKRVEGNLFFLCTEQEQEKGEFGRLSRTGSSMSGECPLYQPLTRDFHRRDACLYPAYEQRAGDRETDYFFAFRVAAEARPDALRGEDHTKETAGCVIYCRLETPGGVLEYHFPVWSGGTKCVDFERQRG